MTNDKNLYQGEMLIQTAITEKGKQEKIVYTKSTFIKDKILNLDTKGTQIALKYNLEDIDNFQKSGMITPAEAESLKEEITNLDAQMEAFRKWKKENPQAPKKEELKAFEKIKKLTDTKTKELKTKDFNLAIRKLISQKDSSETSPLFKSINPITHFAITKPLMDRLYHLPQLLENAKAILVSEDQWEIKSAFTNKAMGPIGLVHSFRAASKEDAKQYLDNYKKWMKEEGLKTLTAYWKTAGKKNKFNYSSALTELMDKNSDDDRTAFFSVKEKQRFWAATRKLENTKLTIEIPISKKKPNGKGKEKEKLIIEHRLVDVGGKIQNSNEDSYPNNVIVKVLNSEEFSRQSQIATAIHNNTLKLPQKDILLALTIQARKAQTQNKDTNSFDENFLIKRANLQKTAESNKSKARHDLNKKLDRLEEDKIIEGYSTKGRGLGPYNIKSASKKNT